MQLHTLWKGRHSEVELVHHVLRRVVKPWIVGFHLARVLTGTVVVRDGGVLASPVDWDLLKQTLAVSCRSGGLKQKNENTFRL